MAINLVVAKTQFLEGVVALPLSGDGGAVVEEAEDRGPVHEGEVGLDTSMGVEVWRSVGELGVVKV